MESTLDRLPRPLQSRLEHLPRELALEWPGGRIGAAASAVRLRLHRRGLLGTLAGGRIGDIADAYVRGELDIEGRLSDVMAVAAQLTDDPRQSGRRAAWPRWLGHWRSRWRHRLGRDAQQVRFHYDLGDDFYALWLDPLRVYSCAYYPSVDATLAQAQQAKLDLICRKLQLAPGQRLLDLGCGWGALLVWAARRFGVRALGLTLSRHQHAHVSRLIEDTGLANRVEVRLLDYRDLPATERFDRIASIGMFEHVGHARLGTYFDTLWRLLRPGGLLLNHGIAAGGLGHDQLGAGIGDFVERHIFPGGELVHVAAAVQALAGSGFELVDAENLRPHYARTLWDWSSRLEAQLPAARALSNEATVRAYRLYLAGSAMAFERGWLALYQLLATRPRPPVEPGAAWATSSDYPFRREHMLQRG